MNSIEAGVESGKKSIYKAIILFHFFVFQQTIHHNF
jgi:hypothetical protein